MNLDYLTPIYTLIASDTDVLSIIGDGTTIFFNTDETDKKRYIVIYEVSETRVNYSKKHIKRIQINCYHTDKYKCAQLAEYVDTVLHTFTGAQSGVVFTSIYNVASTGLTQTDNGEYITINDYRVIYT